MEKNDEIHDNTQKCKCNINLKELICLLSIPIIILFFLILGICICNNSQPKSILASQVTTNDPFVRGFSPINFYANTIKVGNDITHEEGSTDFILNSPGIYQISYQVLGDLESSAQSRFQFSVAIEQDGSFLDTTESTSPLLDKPNRMTLSNTLLVKVTNSSTIKLLGLSLENVKYTRATIYIVKNSDEIE